MPQIATWSELPAGIRDHLVERMRDRKISLDDLNQLRVWIESRPTFLKMSGTRTLARSNFAVRAGIPRLSF
jgi:hypothetical protein